MGITVTFPFFNLSRREFAMKRVSILNIDKKRIPEECSPDHIQFKWQQWTGQTL